VTRCRQTSKSKSFATYKGLWYSLTSGNDFKSSTIWIYGLRIRLETDTPECSEVSDETTMQRKRIYSPNESPRRKRINGPKEPVGSHRNATFIDHPLKIGQPPMHITADIIQNLLLPSTLWTADQLTNPPPYVSLQPVSESTSALLSHALGLSSSTTEASCPALRLTPTRSHKS
jgi:hypothetical protein